MYTEKLGLKARPFDHDAGRQCFVANAETATLLTRLAGILGARGAVAVVTGGPGVGKSTLVRCAAAHAGGRANLIFADLRQGGTETLFETLLLGLGETLGDGGEALVAQRLGEAIARRADAGEPVTAVIDLPGMNAERARRLLRLVQLPGAEALNLVLLGPHTLHKVFDAPGLIHLRQRIRQRGQVRPLSAAETRAYLEHGIELAGGNPDVLLAGDVTGAVHHFVAGVPRLINTLMEACLAEAALVGQERLEAALVQRVAGRLGWRPLQEPAARPAAAARPERAPSALERAAGARAPRAAAEPSRAPLPPPSERTAALMVADLELDRDEGPSGKDPAAETYPVMDPQDPGATGMLRLEDLDARLAESVFGAEASR